MLKYIKNLYQNLIISVNEILKKERNIMDARDVSWYHLLGHSSINFLLGLTSGITIAFVSLFLMNTNFYNAIKLSIFYLIYNLFESKVINRKGYTTKLGKRIILPFPKMFGFVLGAFLSTLI